MFRKLFLSLCLLLTSVIPGFANWPDPRIVILQDGGTAAFINLDGQIKLLSCAHKGGGEYWNVGDKLRFKTCNGTVDIATFVAVDKQNDCSILSFQGSVTAAVKPFTLSPHPASPGERVRVIGFPISYNGQNYRIRPTVTIQEDQNWLTLKGKGTPGESGGPVVTDQDEVVGILTASPNIPGTNEVYDESLCSPHWAITQMCRGYCQNGVCQVSYPNNSPPVIPVEQPQPQPTPTQPIIDKNANCEKQEQEIQLLREQLAALKKQIDGYKECQCGNHATEVDAKIMAAIANIKFPPQEKPQPVDIKQVASEVQKSLPPVYIRVDPRSEYQPVRPGQYVTLPLNKVKVQ